MTPNEVIYHIKQNRQFTEIWAHFTREEKEDVVRRMETQKPQDIEKVLMEVKTGQNRLF
jgi:hypothetical protein